MNKIGILKLSTKSTNRVQTNNKLKIAKKCNIISEKHDDILIRTNKEFNTSDLYVIINPCNNTLVETLGVVGNKDDDHNIYYYLYTHNWMSNSKYSSLWTNYLKNNENYDLNERTDYTDIVITVDPLGSVDLDDGFSVKEDENYFYVDVHISDPTSYYNFNDSDMEIIFNELKNRLCTCYIKNYKSNNIEHLLPKVFINKTSLLETNELNKFRRAITFKFKISKIDNRDISFDIEKTKLYNIQNKTYKIFDEEINKNLNIKNSYVCIVNKLIEKLNIPFDKIENTIDISHKFVEILMIAVNFYGGNYIMKKYNKMYVRTQKESFTNDNVPEYVKSFLNYGAIYEYIEGQNNKFHHSLKLYNYCHMSSPMRRFVDMLNHLLLNECIINNIQITFDEINEKLKIMKRICNSYEIIEELKNNNKFKAYIIDYNESEELIKSNKIINLLLVIHREKFKKIINVQLPILTTINIEKFTEINIELYYNSSQFRSNKYPFYIKIIE